MSFADSHPPLVASREDIDVTLPPLGRVAGADMAVKDVAVSSSRSAVRIQLINSTRERKHDSVSTVLSPSVHRDHKDDIIQSMFESSLPFYNALDDLDSLTHIQHGRVPLSLLHGIASDDVEHALACARIAVPLVSTAYIWEDSQLLHLLMPAIDALSAHSTHMKLWNTILALIRAICVIEPLLWKRKCMASRVLPPVCCAFDCKAINAFDYIPDEGSALPPSEGAICMHEYIMYKLLHATVDVFIPETGEARSVLETENGVLRSDDVTPHASQRNPVMDALNAAERTLQMLATSLSEAAGPKCNAEILPFVGWLRQGKASVLSAVLTLFNHLRDYWMDGSLFDLQSADEIAASLLPERAKRIRKSRNDRIRQKRLHVRDTEGLQLRLEGLYESAERSRPRSGYLGVRETSMAVPSMLLRNDHNRHGKGSMRDPALHARPMSAFSTSTRPKSALSRCDDTAKHNKLPSRKSSAFRNAMAARGLDAPPQLPPPIAHTTSSHNNASVSMVFPHAESSVWDVDEVVSPGFTRFARAYHTDLEVPEYAVSPTKSPTTTTIHAEDSVVEHLLAGYHLPPDCLPEKRKSPAPPKTPEIRRSKRSITPSNHTSVISSVRPISGVTKSVISTHSLAKHSVSSATKPFQKTLHGAVQAYGTAPYNLKHITSLKPFG